MSHQKDLLRHLNDRVIDEQPPFGGEFLHQILLLHVENGYLLHHFESLLLQVVHGVVLRGQVLALECVLLLAVIDVA